MSVKDGLPDTAIFSLAKDKTGYLWIGSPSGLVRYDGKGFKTFTDSPTSTISLDTTEAGSVFVDSQQRFWIGSWGQGVTLFDPSMKRIGRYKHAANQENSLSSNMIQTFFEDSLGNVWLGTNGGGLSRYNNESQDFTNFTYDVNNNKSLSHNRVWSITETKNGFLWIATTDGLNKMSINSPGNFVHFKHHSKQPHSLNSSLVRSVFADNNDKLWVGTQVGFGEFNVNTESFVSLMPETGQAMSSITCIKQGKNNTLWIGTQKGVYFFNSLNKQFIPLVNNKYNVFSYNDIRDIIVDDSGVLWVATRYNGLIKLKIYNNVFKSISTYINDSEQQHNIKIVSTIFEDKQRNVWVGSSEGLLFLTAKSERFKLFDSKGYFSKYKIESIVEDNHGVLWIGGSFGLYSLDKKRKQLINRNDLMIGVKSFNITSLAWGKHNTLWIGTWFSGVIKIKKGEISYLQHDEKNNNSISGNEVTHLYEDRAANLWVSTVNKGLNLVNFNQTSFIRYQYDKDLPESLSDNQVRFVFQTTDKNLWVATRKSLDKLNYTSDLFEHFVVNDNSLKYNFKSIVEDDFGDLWLGTDVGISQYKTKQNYFINFDESDGLKNSTFQIRSAIKSSSGVLYFGSINGVTAIDPAHFSTNNHAPNTAITDVWLNKKPLKQYQFNQHKPLTINYPLQSLKIEFAGMDFLDPMKNNYSFYLENFDEKYNKANYQHYTSYTNLDPGRYVFHVKSSNNNGVWGNERLIEIIVLPSWWQLIWVQIIGLLMVMLLILTWHRNRINKLDIQKHELENEVQKRTKELLLADKHLVDAEKNAAISGLVVGVAHEINTPVGISVTAASHVQELVSKLLASHKNKTMRASEFVSVMSDVDEGTKLVLRNLQRASELISSFKLVSVDQSSEERRLFNLNEYIHNVIFSLSSNIKEANATVNVDCDKDIKLDSYPGAIAQIITNLILNAIIHGFENKQNGVIDISVEHDDEWLTMEVTDNGVGIEDEQLKRIFEAFYTSKRGQGGSGLGLHIVQNIVTVRLGGKISCNSKPGHGASFQLKFLFNPQ
ncbi:MAG: hypothetical protein COB35_09185 [Gammaproteobacteria bacterium]|nr:MAG: hypothetical protein COB35_09185 [Gammaproteobacteria bacterium]